MHKSLIPENTDAQCIVLLGYLSLFDQNLVSRYKKELHGNPSVILNLPVFHTNIVIADTTQDKERNIL